MKRLKRISKCIINCILIRSKKMRTERRTGPGKISG